MRSFFTFLFFVLLLPLLAQYTGYNNALKLEQHLGGDHNLHTILVRGKIELLRAKASELSYTVNYSAGDIASLTCNLQQLSVLFDQKILRYAELSLAGKKPLNDTMLYRNRIIAVKSGQSPLTQAYNGSGIVIGIIDTGVEFNHPDLKDSLGKTRIKFLWDQVPVSGSAVPQPFNYGIEWTAAQIDAKQCTHDDSPNFGHGSLVTGIAAGNGLGNGSFEGVASRADIIVVAVNFNKQAPVTADAVQYIFAKAAAMGKPCVINASIGDYYGSHDGTDLETQMIEAQVHNIPGRVMVAAVGNAGQTKYHVKTQPALNDTSFTWIKKNSLSLDYWCYSDTSQVKGLLFSVGADRSDFSDLGRMSFKTYTYALNSVKSDTLYHLGNRIGIIKSSSAINSSGVYELYMQISADTSNLLWRIETKGLGLHHAWNFDFVSNGLPTITQMPAMLKYARPDTLYTMVSGFQCSDDVITVANYHNLRYYTDVNNTFQDNGLTPGAIAPGSSLGPTRDGRQKPDIAASGQFIFSTPPLTMLPNLIANAPQVVAQGSLHVSGGGSSAASPIVAGLACLYLEKNPTATNLQVKQAITQCSYKDTFTGFSLPNYQWGYGKLDGKNALLCGTITNLMFRSGNNQMTIYPNPVQEKLHLISERMITNGEVQIYSANGSLLYTETITGKDIELSLENLKGAHGLFLLRITDRERIQTFKLIKE